MTPAPLLSRLPRLDPTPARLRTRAIAALHGGELPGGSRSCARLASADERAYARAWLRCESWAGPIHIAPLVGVTTPDAADLCAALGPLEPLLALAERALRVELAPGAVEAELSQSVVVLALGTGRDPLLLLALEPDCALQPAPAPARAPTHLLVPVRAELRLRPPALTAAQLATLAPGDLMLLAAEQQAELRLPTPAPAIHGRYDLRSATLRVHAALSQETSMTLTQDDDPEAAAPVLDAAALAALDVPVTVALEPLNLPLASLAALQPGSVLECPAAGGASLPVRLLVADRTVATGELVVVGDAYGVLIHTRADEG